MIDLITPNVEIVGVGMHGHDLVNDLPDDAHGVVVTRTNTLWHLGNISEEGKLFMFQNILQVSKSLYQRDHLKFEIFTELNKIFHFL